MRPSGHASRASSSSRERATRLTVGILWIEQHGMTSAVGASNRGLLEPTLLFLLFVR
jgi:hypothetical protein